MHDITQHLHAATGMRSTIVSLSKAAPSRFSLAVRHCVHLRLGPNDGSREERHFPELAHFHAARRRPFERTMDRDGPLVATSVYHEPRDSRGELYPSIFRLTTGEPHQRSPLNDVAIYCTAATAQYIYTTLKQFSTWKVKVIGLT